MPNEEDPPPFPSGPLTGFSSGPLWCSLPPTQAFVGAPSQASALVWDDFEFADEFLDMTGNNNNNK